MSDPKAMTLEEAVEIIDTPTCMNDEAIARYTRARAIVDQAVKAHKALTQYADLPSTAAIHDQFGAKNKWMEAVDKLRALERGESEGKP